MDIRALTLDTRFAARVLFWNDPVNRTAIGEMRQALDRLGLDASISEEGGQVVVAFRPTLRQAFQLGFNRYHPDELFQVLAGQYPGLLRTFLRQRIHQLQTRFLEESRTGAGQDRLPGRPALPEPPPASSAHRARAGDGEPTDALEWLDRALFEPVRRAKPHHYANGEDRQLLQEVKRTLEFERERLHAVRSPRALLSLWDEYLEDPRYDELDWMLNRLDLPMLADLQSELRARVEAAQTAGCVWQARWDLGGTDRASA